MKLLACSVMDKQVGAFLPVFFARAKGEAMRNFMSAVSDPSTPFYKNPGDYDLYVLAEFDDINGRFVSDDSMPFRVMSGLDVPKSS